MGLFCMNWYGIKINISSSKLCAVMLISQIYIIHVIIIVIMLDWGTYASY